MNVIIVGLGRMGTGLAIKLSKQGYDVTAIDRDPETFKGLGEDFAGEKVVGVGFDREVLESAGIDRAGAVIACTASDEANIVVAHIARSVFRVPRVIARLYDLSKAETYRRLGIQTISTTEWGITRTCELLTYDELDGVFEVGSGDVTIVRADVPSLLEDTTVREITAVGEVNVVAISRDNDTFIPTQGTIFKHGDIIYAAVAASATKKFKTMLGMAE
ncbi:MAG: TrkA family potassium uptake protein [Atopobiaceae bacterium]|jgi:trk system potassium uptake protein TrkA|nr:TrkA family potassium uptake protein [Atopobiaceae bacterium]MCI2173705.1 TrkA family potassium uptake protein [Atopobiaceae bacterium]MCI2207653.1 TrkA family potassium uptake protein [Atopobiaceae bacterium]